MHTLLFLWGCFYLITRPGEDQMIFIVLMGKPYSWKRVYFFFQMIISIRGWFCLTLHLVLNYSPCTPKGNGCMQGMEGEMANCFPVGARPAGGKWGHCGCRLATNVEKHALCQVACAMSGFVCLFMFCVSEKKLDISVWVCGRSQQRSTQSCMRILGFPPQATGFLSIRRASISSTIIVTLLNTWRGFHTLILIFGSSKAFTEKRKRLRAPVQSVDGLSGGEDG